MVDTVNITRQMERNANLGISDFYLVEDGEGKLDWTGTMDLCRVLEIVRKKLFEQKSCDLSAWVPVKPLPGLPATLDQVLKSPDMLKKTAKIFMEWLMFRQNIAIICKQTAIICAKTAICFSN